MKSSCSIALLESALSENLPAGDEVRLQRHLEECNECSAALEQMAGGPNWCQEAASLLVADELDATAPSGHRWSEVDFSVEHLEPSDEPNVLGRLGGYDVLAVIGHGGMGVVLKGFDRELKRLVAIKVLAPHLAHSPLAKKRFAREAQAAAAVVHPHVLAIHQVQAGGRLPFLVMPLVAGESLAERLAAKGTLELKEILRIGMQAAAGLAAAHEQGLVHRDVKPANILLEKGIERAVLTDFGLARAADDATLTRWGIVAGTPQYMSPEQARGDALDGRSDLFSLGCVLYEMATGVSPFRTDSMLATMRRLVDDAPQAMESLNPELPPWFIAIVERLLEKDPARRFGSAKEVSELLERCLAHLQQPGVVPLPTELSVERHVMPSRPIVARHMTRRRGAIAALLLLGFGGLGAFHLATDEPSDISGKWTGAGWGEVELKQTGPTEYAGTYSDTFGKPPGKIEVKWSRLERRYNGTWSEGKDRFGNLSIRQVDDEIRGGWTTDRDSRINPATPALSDLLWLRPDAAATGHVESSFFAHQVPFEVGASYIADGDQITIEEVRGTAATIKPGNLYEVRGKYKLASHPKATLSAYTTTNAADATAKQFDNVPTQKTQSKTFDRGEGRFDLIFYMWCDGNPHVSFYDDKGSFTGVYFGTGENVLKKGWWEAPNPVQDLLKQSADVQRITRQQRYEDIRKIRPDGGQGTPNGSGVETQNLSFGPVIERTLRYNSPGPDAGPQGMLNLESGDVISHGHPGQDFDKDKAWALTHDADLIACGDGGGRGLRIIGGMAIQPANWDASPREVIEAISKMEQGIEDYQNHNPGFRDPREAGFSNMWVTGNDRPTFYFKTRKGTLGTLQITEAIDGARFFQNKGNNIGVEVVPHRVTFRYKLLTTETSKRQRFVPVEGKAGDTNWSVMRPPSLYSKTDWAVQANMTLGGEASIELPGDKLPWFTIKLIKGDDDSLTLQAQDVARKSKTVVTIARNQWAQVTVDGIGYKFYYPTVNVAIKDSDTSPFAHVIVIRVEERNQVPGNAAAAGKAVFGPVMERVLPYGAPCRQQHFQFRGGEVFVVGSGPATTKEEFEADWKKVEDAGGADISLGSNAGIQLVGQGCIFTQDFQNLHWDTFTAEQVVSAMQRVSFSYGVMEPAVKDLPITYLFKTARGEVGMMEILGIVDDERGFHGNGQTGRGMKFHYKLVRQETTKAANRTLADPALVPQDSSQATGSNRTSSSVPIRVQNFQTSDPVNTIAYSPDGKLIAIANVNPVFPLSEEWKLSVEILDGETGEKLISLRLTTGDEDAALASTEGLPHFEVGAMAFSHDGNLLAVGTGIGQVKLFDPRTGELIRALDDEPAKLAETKTPKALKYLKRAMGAVGSIAFSSDGSLLATSGSSFEDIARNWGGIDRLGLLSTGPGRLKVWDVKTGKLTHDLAGYSHAEMVAFSSDGNLLACAGRWLADRAHGDGVIVWNPHDGKKLSTIVKDSNGGSNSVVFLPNRKLLTIGSRQFDKENDTSSTSISLVYALSGITDWQHLISGWAIPKAFLHDGKTLAVLCGGKSIEFFDTETGTTSHRMTLADDQGGRWNDFAIAPQAKTLVIGGSNSEKRGIIEVWNLDGAPADGR